MHPQHALKQALAASPGTISDLLSDLPTDHFATFADSTEQGKRYLAEAASLNWGGDANRLEGTANSFYVHSSVEWWVVTGWVHPPTNDHERAHPDSPVVLFARNFTEQGLHPLVYGPEVVKLAYRLLGNALARHVMLEEPMRTMPFTGSVPQ